ncbi:hypothetical protein INR49_022433 [Caranx melampygus]|nr:hypothetical protein INR49_022433 [Caranx melampygus]
MNDSALDRRRRETLRLLRPSELDLPPPPPPSPPLHLHLSPLHTAARSYSLPPPEPHMSPVMFQPPSSLRGADGK